MPGLKPGPSKWLPTDSEGPGFTGAWIMKLLIATTNANKVREIRPLLARLPIELVTLRGSRTRFPSRKRPATTFWENARLKALAYAAATGLTVVAEDSGLEIAALDGEPGVQSARFLGPDVPYPVRFDGDLSASARRSRARRVTRDSSRRSTVARGDEILFETEASIEGIVADAPSGETRLRLRPDLLLSAARQDDRRR